MMTRQSWIAMGIQTVMMLGGIVGFLFANMATKEDIRLLREDISELKSSIKTLNQNHLQHITQLHAQKIITTAPE
ncbi:MAG: hypothetical protein OXN17_06085 [Candidatus Poribacteria bacterium]|nr:hypothetical protein [Candidatus Poribacteria bacterium]MDE0504184.1 hypothetical protein [Candidatus Poribacteria bacterium]